MSRASAPWIIVVAVIVHVCWGLLLLRSAAPLGTVSLAESPWSHNQYLAAIVYFAAAALAMVPFLWRRADDTILGLYFCLPQQALMVLSATTALRCVLRATYADGVPRPWEFIAADQMWTIVGTVGHTLALLDWYYFSRRPR